MHSRLLWPFGTLALGRNHQPIVLHVHIDRIILEPGHLDVETVGILVLDHVRPERYILSPAASSIRRPNLFKLSNIHWLPFHPFANTNSI
jgi:hypothetical protein